MVSYWIRYLIGYVRTVRWNPVSFLGGSEAMPA